MRANRGVWGAESAIHQKPHSVHSLPGNALHVVPLICMAAMVQIYILSQRSTIVGEVCLFTCGNYRTRVGICYSGSRAC